MGQQQSQKPHQDDYGTTETSNHEEKQNKTKKEEVVEGMKTEKVVEAMKTEKTEKEESPSNGEEEDEGNENHHHEPPKNPHTLIFSFVAMVLVGVGNSITGKLQTFPMYNYPFFQNIQATFVYIPISFAYIWLDLIWWKSITKEQRAIPKYKFFIMGCFDCLAGMMSTFAVNFIPSGALIVLLMQSSIPISMVLSKVFLKAHYNKAQYIGAVVVLLGITVVLSPSFRGGDGGDDDSGTTSSIGGGKPKNQWLWILIMILSCIPATISSVYKERELGEVEIDVIYLNGWVSLFQFLVNIPFALPSAWITGLRTKDIPLNIWDGSKCWWGINSITKATSQGPADHCEMAFWYTNSYLAFNVIYNILTIVILKYGSSNLLYLSSTVEVPITNLAFSLKIMPGHQPMHSTNIIGLLTIMAGLLFYRYYEMFGRWLYLTRTELTEAEQALVKDMEHAYMQMSRKSSSYLGIGHAPKVGPLVDHRLRLARQTSANRRLRKHPHGISDSFFVKTGLAHKYAQKLADDYRANHNHHGRNGTGNEMRHRKQRKGKGSTEPTEKDPLVPPV